MTNLGECPMCSWRENALPYLFIYKFYPDRSICSTVLIFGSFLTVIKRQVLKYSASAMGWLIFTCGSVIVHVIILGGGNHGEMRWLCHKVRAFLDMISVPRKALREQVLLFFCQVITEFEKPRLGPHPNGALSLGLSTSWAREINFHPL